MARPWPIKFVRGKFLDRDVARIASTNAIESIIHEKMAKTHNARTNTSSKAVRWLAFRENPDRDTFGFQRALTYLLQTYFLAVPSTFLMTVSNSVLRQVGYFSIELFPLKYRHATFRYLLAHNLRTSQVDKIPWDLSSIMYM